MNRQCAVRMSTYLSQVNRALWSVLNTLCVFILKTSIQNVFIEGLYNVISKDWAHSSLPNPFYTLICKQEVSIERCVIAWAPVRN